MDTIILGIESSCDDTSAAVIKNGVLLSNVVSSQAVHEAYGGVVPELASRAHQQNIVPVVHEALKKGRSYQRATKRRCIHPRTRLDGIITGRSIFCERFRTFIEYTND